jgi:hypothetical protein
MNGLGQYPRFWMDLLIPREWSFRGPIVDGPLPGSLFCRMDQALLGISYCPLLHLIDITVPSVRNFINPDSHMLLRHTLNQLIYSKILWPKRDQLRSTKPVIEAAGPILRAQSTLRHPHPFIGCLSQVKAERVFLPQQCLYERC